MKQKTKKQITYWLSVIVIGIALGLGLQFVRAWTEPTAAPPGGNVGAPINTSAIAQTKVGAIYSSDRVGAPYLCIGTDCRNAWPSGGGGGGTVDSGTCREYAVGNPRPPFFHNNSCYSYYAADERESPTYPSYCDGYACQCREGTRFLRAYYTISWGIVVGVPEEWSGYILDWSCHLPT